MSQMSEFYIVMLSCLVFLYGFLVILGDKIRFI